MKISIALLAVASIGISSAHAEDAVYFQNTAQSILNTLQTKANSLNASETADLAQLTSARDSQKNIDVNPNAQNRLTDSFKKLFAQSDNIQLPVQTAEPIFGGPRDLYTFCPDGAVVRRHLALSPSLLDPNTPEKDWGWSYCVLTITADSATPTRVSGAIRVQDLWVSNWKKPILTLLMVGSDKINLDINLNDLIAGKVTEAQILKALTAEQE